MAGGPILPTGFVEPFTLVPFGVANVVAPLQFNIPESVPTGTPKLQMICEANATAGVVNLQVSDAAINPSVNPNSTALTNETATAVTFTAANTLIDTKVPLTSAPTANQILLVDVTFLPTSTLVMPSTWQFTLIWE